MNNRGVAAFLGQLKRDRVLRHTAVLGLGVAAVGAGRSLAQELEPTPTPAGPSMVSIQAIPTEPPPPIDDLAAAPTPTIPPSAPTGPTVTPVPETGEPPFEPSPTPELPVSSQPDTGTQESPLPGGGADPDNWICRHGPWGPWWPIVPSRDVTDATGIAWYGVQVDPAEGTFAAVAFGADGTSLSQFTIRVFGSELRVLISGGGGRIDGAFAVASRDGLTVLDGEFAGQAFGVAVNERGEVSQADRRTVALDDAQRALLESWFPAIPKVEGLFDALTTAGGGTSAQDNQTKCFVSGLLLAPSIVGCAASLGLGCAATGVFGSYIWSECTD